MPAKPPTIARAPFIAHRVALASDIEHRQMEPLSPVHPVFRALAAELKAAQDGLAREETNLASYTEQLAKPFEHHEVLVAAQLELRGLTRSSPHQCATSPALRRARDEITFCLTEPGLRFDSLENALGTLWERLRSKLWKDVPPIRRLPPEYRTSNEAPLPMGNRTRRRAKGHPENSSSVRRTIPRARRRE